MRCVTGASDARGSAVVVAGTSGINRVLKGVELQRLSFHQAVFYREMLLPARLGRTPAC